MLTVNDFLPRWSFMKSGFLFHSFGIFAAMAVAAQSGFATNHFGAELAQHARHGGTGGAGVSSMTRMPSRGNCDMGLFP